MAGSEITGKDLESVHKLVYLAREYGNEKKTIRELGELFSMSMLEINATIWRAQDMGYLVIDQETGEYSVDMVPDKWQFGEATQRIRDNLIYVMGKLAGQESDLEDQQLGQWCAGHETHDVAVAVRTLLEDRTIATYDLTTVNEMPVSKKKRGKGEKAKTFESTYTFYTLWDNMEMQWGRKQFKDQDKLK